MEVLSSITRETSFEQSKKILEDKGLIINDYPDNGLYLVKYDKKSSDMTDNDVKLCRGLIIDRDTNNVVCFPPEKSVTLEEFIQNSNTIIYEEFVDGTMINVFHYGGLCYFFIHFKSIVYAL